MNLKKTLGLTVAATAIAASASYAPMASAEVSASVGIANNYLWRGFDLGSNPGPGDQDSLGSAAIFGDITFSTAGFHAGVWGSSGDAFAGNEYDLIVGYGGEAGSFSWDVSVVSYIYANDPGDTDIGDFMEAIVSLGFGPVSFVYHDNIESEPGTYALGEDYSYFNIGLSLGSFSAAIGQHDFDDGSGDKPTHLDLGYAYNDNLSFTISKFIADEDGLDKDAVFNVSYSIPIE